MSVLHYDRRGMCIIFLKHNKNVRLHEFALYRLSSGILGFIRFRRLLFMGNVYMLLFVPGFSNANSSFIVFLFDNNIALLHFSCDK